MNWSEQKFAVIDIETTGGSAVTGKITEIAAYVLQNGELVDQMDVLVNPEQPIPFFITTLTGIDDKMVANSPKFYEIAKELLRVTEDCVFVAHNSNFDYGFIKEEYKQLGYDYDRKTLCTVKLSRKIIPGHASYSLGKLTDELGIQLNNRHRASGDALATVELFKLLIKTNPDFIEDALTEKRYRYKHPYLPKDKVDALPETSGMYCFKNEKDEIIYIGKSINIRERVISHLNQTRSKTNLAMLDEIKNVEFQETGSELMALLEESKEIKRFKPKYNKALVRSKAPFGIFSYKNDEGYICLKAGKVNQKKAVPFITYSSLKQSKSILATWAQEYHLCEKLSGLTDSAGACFYHALGECDGACVGKESVEAYNKRALKLITKYSYFADNFVIVDRGRTAKEKSVILVESSLYRGHGFVDSESIDNIDLIKEQTPAEDNNRDVQKIINSYMKKHPELNVIQF